MDESTYGNILLYYFQPITQEEILLELLNDICEIYIDDLVVMAI